MKDNNNNTVEVKEEVKDEKELKHLFGSFYVAKKPKTVKTESEGSEEPKKESKVWKNVKRIGLAAGGVVAGVGLKTLVDSLGSKTDSDDYVEVVDLNESENE